MSYSALTKDKSDFNDLPRYVLDVSYFVGDHFLISNGRSACPGLRLITSTAWQGEGQSWRCDSEVGSRNVAYRITAHSYGDRYFCTQVKRSKFT